MTPRIALRGLAFAALSLLASSAAADRLIVGSPDGSLHSVHPVTGEVTTLSSGCTIVESMATDGTMVFIGDIFGNVFDYDPATNVMTWRFTLSSDCAAMGVLGSDLLVADTSGEVLRVDRSTGQVLQTETVDSWLQITSMVVDGTEVYLGVAGGVGLRKDYATSESFFMWGTCSGPVASMSQDETHIIMSDTFGHVSKVEKTTQDPTFFWNVDSGPTEIAMHAGELLTAGPGGSVQRIDLGSARNQQVLDTGLQVAAVVVLEDPMPGSAYCYGLQCPCGNDDGLAGCTNSVGEGAWLPGTGSASASADELVLFASNVPAQRFGVLFMTNTPQAGVPFGDGLLCGTGAGGGFRRFAPKNSGQLGFFSHRNLVQASAASFGPGERPHSSVSCTASRASARDSRVRVADGVRPSSTAISSWDSPTTRASRITSRWSSGSRWRAASRRWSSSRAIASRLGVERIRSSGLRASEGSTSRASSRRSRLQKRARLRSLFSAQRNSQRRKLCSGRSRWKRPMAPTTSLNTSPTTSSASAACSPALRAQRYTSGP